MYYWEEKHRGSPSTYALIAINVAVWLFTTLIYQSSPRTYLEILYSYGVVPILVINGVNLHALLTHMFLHDSTGIWHILMNMYMLFLFGREIEQTMGTGAFLLLYFASGLAGAALHILYFTMFFPQPATEMEIIQCFRLGYPPCIPSIGASGAIFGVMASFAVLFPMRRLMVFLGWFIPVAAPAIVVILVLGVIQTLLMLATPFSTVAYTAHVGGFATGLAIAAAYKQRLRRRWLYYGYME